MLALLTPDETTILIATARYPSRGLSDANLAGEAALDPTVARRTVECLVAKGCLDGRGAWFTSLELLSNRRREQD
jgi:hypothetical protein